MNLVCGCLVLLLTSGVTLNVLAVKCPNVAFIVHSNNLNDHVTKFMANTFLQDTNLVVMSGHDSFDTTVESRRHLNLRKVVYDGNPGGFDKTYRTEGRKYLGTHRTMAGILVAMDTLPHVDWVYILDDDNVVNVNMVCDALGRNDPKIPLFLGYVGKFHYAISIYHLLNRLI